MYSWSQLLEIHAHCHDCEATWETANAMGVAAQHARRYNHVVAVVQTIQTMFEKDEGS